MASLLSDLPFPVAELGWDKFSEVQKACNLDYDQTVAVMSSVCGDPPPDFDS